MKKILLCLTAYLSIAISATLAADNPPKNILLITVDDLNAWVGHLAKRNDVILKHLIPQQKQSQLFKRLTPHIDRLANQGVGFNRAYVNAPLCNPSRASFLTGMFPHRLGTYNNQDDFRKNMGNRVATLPEHFKKHGYTTIEAGKIFHKSRGNSANPSVFSDPQSWSIQLKNNVGLYWGYSGNPWTTPSPERRWYGTQLDPNTYWGKSIFFGPVPQNAPLESRSFEKTRDFTNLDYLAKALKTGNINGKALPEPFFMAGGIFRPHMPFIVPQRFFDEIRQIVSEEELRITFFDNKNSGVLDQLGNTAKRFASNNGLYRAITASDKKMGSSVESYNKSFKEYREIIIAYLASIRYADEIVGNVIHALENSRYAKNTTVVLLGDHGWHLGSKAHFGKITLWEEATRVPFVIKDPDNNSQKNVNKPVSLVDLYPTLLDLNDIPNPKQTLDGVSLKPLLSNPSAKFWKPPVINYQRGNYAVVAGNYYYIQYENGEEEFYNLAQDPFQTNNLADIAMYRTQKENAKKQLHRLQ